MNGYMRSMRQYAVFRGRAARAEFWGFVAVTLGLVFVGMVIDVLVSPEVQTGSKKDPALVVTALIALAHLVPAFAVTVRRLHDTERSGWMVLLNYIPPLNLIIVVFACMRGTRGPNHYGPDPLDPNATPAVSRTGPIPVLATPPAGGMGRIDVIAELERLGRLRREGHLNEAEFEVMKAEALAQGRR